MDDEKGVSPLGNEERQYIWFSPGNETVILIHMS